MSSKTPPDDSAIRAETLFAAWAAQVEGGEPNNFESLVRAHSSLEPELRGLHEDWKLFAPILGKAIPGLIADASGLVLPSLARDPDADEIDPPTDELYARLGIHAPSANRYRFRAVLGRGGGGVVLKVWDSKLNRPLAMKVVLGKDEERPSGQTPKVDGRTLSRFVDEARIASQLNHPGIVPVHELGADESGRAFFTMKLVKGEDFARILEKVERGNDGWNPARALNVLLRVCEAMAYAHDKGVIHRDLKPANIMVGSFGEVHVMDWGLARVLGEPDRRDLLIRCADESEAPFGDATATAKKPVATVSAVDSFRKGARERTPDSPLLTMDGSVIGTPSYMSPEQARGEIEDVGMRSDVYAVGAMLYHLIGGEPPYVPRGARVPQAVVLTNVMHGPPKSLIELAPRASAELVAICEKAMARESTRRYGSMLELADDLRAFLDGRVVQAYETGTWAETRKWVQRNKALAGLLVAAILIASTGVIAFAIKSAEADQRKNAASANADRAQRASNEAIAAARNAAWNTYVAAITGAESALRAGEVASVRRLLDSAPLELRNWEWAYLDAQSDTSLLRLEGHTAGVRSASFSPDGTRIVTASADNTARVWDARIGTQLAQLVGHTSSVLQATFGPDGSRIVTASEDKTARVWNAATGSQMFKLEGHTQPVSSVAFSPDGSRIVTASLDGTARVWDVETGAQILKLEGHTSCVSSVAFSPDGSRIVTASDDNTARVWGASSGAQILRLGGHTDRVQSASFSSDGTRIVTACWDNTVRVWDASNGSALALFEGRVEYAFTSAAFSPDGTRILTSAKSLYYSSPPPEVQVWDVQRSKELIRFEGESATFAPDGTRVLAVCRDQTTRVWDAASGRPLERLVGHSKSVQYAAFSPDGERIVTASWDNTARVWDARESEAAHLRHLGCVVSAAFSPDSTRIVTVSNDQTAGIWDSASRTRLMTLDGHGHIVLSCSFSLDCKRVVTASWDGTARVWEALTGHELVRIDVGTYQSVSSASFSPDGARIVAATSEHAARVWDVATGNETATLIGHSGSVTSAAFSPDGTRIVTSSDDGTVRTWDASSGAQVATLGGNTGAVWSANFSPDGTRIVAASEGRTVSVWDTASNALLFTLVGHGDRVNSAAFSPDGTRIVTASMDHTLRVWDVQSRAQLLRLDGAAEFSSVAFSPDGTRLVSSYCELGPGQSSENAARIWDSVPCRVRHAERQAIQDARPQAEHALAVALSSGGDWDQTGARLRGAPGLDQIVRRAALDLLTIRANKSHLGSRTLASRLAERTWIARMLAREPWPSVSDVEATVRVGTSTPDDPAALNRLAWRSMVPHALSHGDELRALILSQRAIAKVSTSPAVESPIHVATLRNTLARALFLVGRFDDALSAQRQALAEAAVEDQKRYQDALSRLESDIAKWRDESGQLRQAEHSARIEQLSREIAALETDPDVRLWLIN